MMRFEGPVVRQNQQLFASDWMGARQRGPERAPARAARAEVGPGFTAQVIGTGPTVRYSAMPEMFESLMYAARRELVITTPYYVPDEPIQAALCASARRGVATTIVFPARNDSWIVAAASRSYYAELLDAGVDIYEYVGGLLHTKSLTLDGEVDADRLGQHRPPQLRAELREQHPVLRPGADRRGARRGRRATSPLRAGRARDGRGWNRRAKVWNNTIAMFGPVL